MWKREFVTDYTALTLDGAQYLMDHTSIQLVGAAVHCTFRAHFSLFWICTFLNLYSFDSTANMSDDCMVHGFLVLGCSAGGRKFWRQACDSNGLC